MNWGTGIALVYGTFALGMAGAAVLAVTQHDPGLVQKDYYNLDLNYQAHLEKKKNTASLQQDVEVAYDPAAQQITLKFPAIEGALSGNIRCTPLQKDGRITSYAILADANRQVSIPAAPGGRVRIEMDWKVNERAFYSTYTLALN